MISKNVVILTVEELEKIKLEAFHRGVRRGRFEQHSDQSRSESNQRQTGEHRPEPAPGL